MGILELSVNHWLSLGHSVYGIFVKNDEHKKELQRKLEEVKELNRQAQESQNVMKQAPDPSSKIPGSNPKESGKKHSTDWNKLDYFEHSWTLLYNLYF